MYDVLSSLAPRAEGGASFNKRLTSQAENVPSSDVPIVNRAASTALPVGPRVKCYRSGRADVRVGIEAEGPVHNVCAIFSFDLVPNVVVD
jgi:hypothetical protein